MDKICLITGANRGLGRSLTQEFKQRGYTVVGLARNEDALKQMQSEKSIDSYFVCDLLQPESIEESIRAFTERHDRLDVLIHNAGIQFQCDIRQSADYTERIREETQINFLAPTALTFGLRAALTKSRGVVIGISSLLHFGPKKSAPGYCASKAAFSSWLINLRAQLQDTGVRVVEVIPGLIRTSMTAAAESKGVDPDILAREIYQGMNQDRLVLSGAKFPWTVSRILPGLVKRKLLES